MDLDALTQRLRSFVRARLRNAADADDLAQDALVVALTAHAERRIQDEFERYLWGCARRLLGERIRRARTTEDLPESLRSRDDPLRDLLAAERRRWVRAQIEELGARDAELLRRAVYDEQPRADTERDMRLTPTQYRLAKSRALRRLVERAKLAASDEWPH